MNKINENLNFYSSYFHGVQDIRDFKSAKQTALGIVKIISGFTLVIPIIFAVGYYISRNELRELESLCGRVSKALKSGDNTEKLTQNDLIKFISKQVLDRDENDFKVAFQKLDPISQKRFFDSMADEGMLISALARIPQDIREINIGFGRNPSRESIDNAIGQLCKFKHLHTITFDVSKSGVYYTRGIESLFERSISAINLRSLFKYSSEISFELSGDTYNLSGVNYPNNSLPASRLFHGVVYTLIEQNPSLAQINFNFKLKPGEFIPMYLANPSKMAKISKEDADRTANINPLNHMRPFPDAPDKWIALGGTGFYS